MQSFNQCLSSWSRNKEKLEEIAITTVNAECSAIIMNKVPEKLEDPGKFLIPCALQELDRTSALADSGASINLLPHSIYKKLELEALTPTRMTLELANRSISHPMGIAEDVVVRVDGFTFLADFVVVNFEPDPRVPIILGRPFLRTAKALIDLYEEKLTLRVGKDELVYYADKSEKNKEKNFVHAISVIDFSKDDPFSGSTTTHSDDPSPSSSPVKTSDNIEKFTDELAPLDSLPSGNDDSTLKKEFHEVNFQVYSNPLFEFDESFRSSNVNPLFEENNKDVEIKSSSSSTLTSPEASELEDYLEKDSIPPGIDLTLPTTLEVLSSNPTFPTLTKEKVCAWETPMFFSLVRFVWKMMTRMKVREHDKPSAQHSRFLKMFKQLRLEIGLKDALVEMPKFNKWLSSLLRNKEKLEEIAITTVNAECSAIIMNKVPEKLEDPGKFLIPCALQELKRTSALADSGASINLLPHSIYKKLGLEALTPTRMTLELANRSISHPMGIAEDVVVRVDGFTFLADFVVVNFEPDPRVPIILGRPFLRTAKALIDLYEEKLTLRVGKDELVYYADKSEKNKDKNCVHAISIIDFSKEDPFSGSTTNSLHPSSSPVKTSDNIEKFTDELAPLNSLPSGNDDSTLKKEFHEVNFQVYSNPLFEFDESFKSSNVNPLFEENNKDVEIKSSSSSTLTSPEASELEDYLEKDSIPPGIDLTLPTTLEVLSSNPTFPTLTKEKVCAWETPMFFSLVRFVWKMMTRIAIRKKIICILATYLHKKPKPLSQEVEEIKEKEVEEVSSIVPIDTIDLKKDLPISFDSTTHKYFTTSFFNPLAFHCGVSASVTLNSSRKNRTKIQPGILFLSMPIHDKNLVTLEKNLKENISSGTLLVFKEPSFLLPPAEPPNECLKNAVLTFQLPIKDFLRKAQVPLSTATVLSTTMEGIHHHWLSRTSRLSLRTTKFRDRVELATR
ncbi:reverse transcriptase domain-containing protein, partial [Tanacetum coccineum]